MSGNMKKFADFLSDEDELSENTVKTYLWTMTDFFKRFDVFNSTNAVAYKRMLMDSVSAKTVNVRISALRKYADYAGELLKIKNVKIQKRSSVDNIPSVEEYRRFVERIEESGDQRTAAEVMILATTGMRISEAVRLRKKDLDNGYLDICSKGKFRHILIPAGLAGRIKNVYAGFAPEDYIFASRARKGEHITTRGFDSKLKLYAEKLGFTKEHMHAHAFRHLFAIEFLKRSNNITLLADLLGHSGLNTTMIYTRQSEQQQREELNKAVDWQWQPVGSVGNT